MGFFRGKFARKQAKKMRQIIFLFPQSEVRSGGHIAQRRLYENTAALFPAQAVTYQEKETGFPFLDDLLRFKTRKHLYNNYIFVVHWGPHVPTLVERLKGLPVVYMAYSTGYPFQIPPTVPILASSRHTLSYWGRHAPSAPLFYLPCEIPPEFQNRHLNRDIDVLVQRRKTSAWVLEELLPRLQSKCNVVVLDEWVEDLSEYFNRAKVYLYHSVDYWKHHHLSEGFGLPPLEAIACGCTVFSSVNDALGSYLDPGFNVYQLGVTSVEYDVQRILHIVENWQDPDEEPSWLAEYRKPAIRQRIKRIFSEINDYFDFLGRLR